MNVNTSQKLEELLVGLQTLSTDKVRGLKSNGTKTYVNEKCYADPVLED
jgi:hypothetical protein